MTRYASPGYAKARTSPIQRIGVEVSSWLGETLLADAVPVLGGTVKDDEAAEVRGVLELTVPASGEWIPLGTSHPLANFGQTLRVTQVCYGLDGTITERFALGAFLIERAVPDGDQITVTAHGLAKRIELARFTAPLTLPASTLAGVVRSLLRGVLPVAFDPALVDRSTTERSWERERLEALREVLDAWPAILEVDASGVAYIRAPYGGGDLAPVETYAEDGPDATAVDVAADVDASGVVNAITAATVPDSAATPIWETARITSGPLRWGGPFGYRPGFYASPLLTTRAQCRSAANAILDRSRRRAFTVRAEVVSDGRREVGDVVRVTSARADVDVVGRVTAISHGLTPADQPSELVLSVLSGTVRGESVLT